MDKDDKRDLTDLMEKSDRTDKTTSIFYRILDPTGNITALVETPCPPSRYAQIASALMQQHPRVEQVGFVHFGSPDQPDALPSLEMAGGEFCGNASMCAAAMYSRFLGEKGDPEPNRVLLKVSGAALPVEVSLSRKSENEWAASVTLPPAESIEVIRLADKDRPDDLSVELPIVRMEGIYHLVIEQDSPCYLLKENPRQAQAAVKAWCAALQAPGLGLMFLEKQGAEYALTPLVYIPGSDTLFWENSCASGSGAVGMLLAQRKEGFVRLALHEPGGVLAVEAQPAGQTCLFGTVREIGSGYLD